MIYSLLLLFFTENNIFKDDSSLLEDKKIIKRRVIDKSVRHAKFPHNNAIFQKRYNDLMDLLFEDIIFNQHMTFSQKPLKNSIMPSTHPYQISSSPEIILYPKYDVHPTEEKTFKNFISSTPHPKKRDQILQITPSVIMANTKQLIQIEIDKDIFSPIHCRFNSSKDITIGYYISNFTYECNTPFLKSGMTEVSISRDSQKTWSYPYVIDVIKPKTSQYDNPFFIIMLICFAFLICYLMYRFQRMNMNNIAKKKKDDYSDTQFLSRNEINDHPRRFYLDQSFL